MKPPAMNPKARAFIDQMIALAPAPLHQMSAPEARTAFNERSSRVVRPPAIRCETADRLVSDVPVRIYQPPAGSGEPGPALVYFHGGGWVVGTLEMVDALCHDLCALSDAVVVSVDYRLAPEHPFPAPLEDGQAVLEALRVEAGDMGINPRSIIVAGDSAGGNIAAVLALAEAAAGRVLAGQVLLYPVTDVSAAHLSKQRFAAGLNLDAATMAWFYDAYQPDPAKRDDWRISPLLAPMTASPAPALVITAGYDLLHDEGAAYAERLAAAGTRVEYLDFATQIHGFANQTLISRDPDLLRDAVAGFIRRRGK